MSAAILEALKQFPEVARAKAEIDAKSTGSVSFTIHATPEIQSAIAERFGLPTTSLETIPMRWIKGDTLPHVDTGVRSFDRTHLMYLTDSPGSFHIGDASYPITEGAVYSFAEGVAHETRDTGDAPRLLVGPMSESGFAVGGPIGNLAFPGGTTVSIRDNSGSIEYSTDGVDWFTIASWPSTIENTSTSDGNVIIEFTTDISLNSADKYFICDSDHIQFGSSSLKTDGTRPVITIDGVTGYPGLIQNGNSGSDGNDDIFVYNLDVHATNGSTLAFGEGDGAGWVCQAYFGKGAENNYVINCTSDGPIAAYCGGIAGSFANLNGSFSGYIGCSSSGYLDTQAGGILGTYAGQTTNDTGNIGCISCWTTGAIEAFGAGGIVGGYSTRVHVTSCYSEGVISGEGAGGIVGRNAAQEWDGSPGVVDIANCYSTGLISGNDSGGILGKDAQSTVTVTNCYTLGFNIGTNAGGICGPNPTDTTITNCYTTGTTVDPSSGYIVGGSATVGPTNYSEAANSSSGWSTTNANTVLLGLPAPVIGTAWVSTGVNQPYELRAMGYTPYTTENISGFTALQNSYPAFTVGYVVEKDMANDDYRDEFDPSDFQADFFPGMADISGDNIVAGDKDEADRLTASYWSDLGNDVFDDWGYFYLYDVTSGKYYFPLLAPQNQADGSLTTQTFNAFGRTFTITHGWAAQGIFQFDISVADSLPFRFGAYGNMGSDGDQVTADYTQAYTVNGTPRTLYYRKDAEDGDSIEILYSYFVPKNAAQATTVPYNVYYDGDDMSMVSKELTTGLTVFFAKTNDVKNWVINRLGGGGGVAVTPGGSTPAAIVSGKSYEILQIEDGDAGSYATITMDSTTGAISTTTSTVPGTYTIYLRNTGSYNITTYELTVLGETAAGGPCCPIPLNLKGLDYTERAEALAGNAILVGPSRVKPLLQSDRMKMLKAYALRR